MRFAKALLFGALTAMGIGFMAIWARQPRPAGTRVRPTAKAIAIGFVIVAAGIMAARATGLWPGGGEALGLTGARLGVAIVGNMFLGALMTLGIGLFAPCMIMVALLGMNETAAFPIMMGSCAFLMPGASVRFVRSGRYDLAAALGLTLGGAPAVVIAGLWIKSLPLAAVKWLVVVVVVYTALAMLRSAVREGQRRHG